MSDEKARRILFDTYWSPQGWRSERNAGVADFAYAKQAGYMFDPVRLSHDTAVARARNACADLLPREVARAFVASLTTRDLAYHSALGSYALLRHLPEHDATGDPFCDVCGCLVREDTHNVNVLNFERYKWGGVRHSDPVYAAFDLEQLGRLPEPSPTAEDWRTLDHIIRTVALLAPDARPRNLERALKGVLPSNKQEREILLQILAYCGILQPQGKFGFFQGFVPAWAREDPPVSKTDWTYPFAWWRAADGVNEEALRFWFPEHAS